MNSTMVGLVLLLGLGGFLLTGCQGSAPNPQPDSTAAPSSRSPGQAIFANYCATCHAGGGNMMAPDKPLKGSPQLATAQSFTAYLRSPGGAMPPFSPEQISDEDAAQLYKYVSTEYKQ